MFEGSEEDIYIAFLEAEDVLGAMGRACEMDREAVDKRCTAAECCTCVNVSTREVDTVNITNHNIGVEQESLV